MHMNKDLFEFGVNKDELDFREYNHFVESIPSHTGLGEFKDTQTIPKTLILKARKTIRQSISDADEEEINFEQTDKFYGKPEIFAREISFLLNQCSRAGSECFKLAKDFILS